LIGDLYEFLPWLARLYGDVDCQATETPTQATGPHADLITRTAATLAPASHIKIAKDRG
jgi:hypothetical protein